MSPRTFIVSDTLNTPIFTSLLVQIVQACPALRDIDGLHWKPCLDRPALVKAINDHPNIQNVWVTLEEPLSTAWLESVASTERVLRKFKCESIRSSASLSPSSAPLSTLLGQGFQIQRLLFRDEDSARSWLTSPYLSITQALMFRILEYTDEESMAAMLAAGVRDNHSIISVRLVCMPLVVFRLANRTASSALSRMLRSARLRHYVQAQYQVDSSRRLVCHHATFSLGVDSNSVDTDNTVDVAGVLNEMCSAVPSARSLSIEFPSNVNFPDALEGPTGHESVTHNVSTLASWVHALARLRYALKDELIVAAFSQLKYLEYLTVYSTAQAPLNRIRLLAVVLPMAKMMQALQHVVLLEESGLSGSIVFAIKRRSSALKSPEDIVEETSSAGDVYSHRI